MQQMFFGEPPYLSDVLRRLPAMNITQIAQLLPGRWKAQPLDSLGEPHVLGRPRRRCGSNARSRSVRPEPNQEAFILASFDRPRSWSIQNVTALYACQ